jgi:tripartite-type tricarboxylate transporter receptor subunit TctC
MWKSAPDGLTLSFLAAAGIGDELVDSSAQFKTDKFTQIGSHAKRDVVLIARGTVPYNAIPEGRNSKTVLTLAEAIGSPEDISGKLLATGMLSLWFDVPMRIATVARSGSADALVMLDRGDINAYIAGSHWYSLPTLRPGWFAKGFVKPIADLGHPESPSIPNSEISMPVPNAITWLNDEQKRLWRGIYLPDVLSGKGIAGPPNMPPEITKVLRDAYVAALKDPGFAKGLEKLQGQPVALINGEKLQHLVVEATKDFKEYLPRYKEVRQKVYDKVVR